MLRVRPRRLRWCAWLALAGALRAGPAVASPPADAPTPPALTWRAPPECPQREAVATWLSGHLGARADPAGYPGLTSRGVLEREGAGWRLRLILERDGGRGEKTLRGRDCVELARSGALALAIAIEPGLAQAGAAEEETPGAAPPPAPPGEKPKPRGPGETPKTPGPGEARETVPPPPGPGETPKTVPPPGPGETPKAVPPPPRPGQARETAPSSGDRRENAPPVDGPREGVKLPGPLRSEVSSETAPLDASPPPARPRLPVGHALRLAAGLEFGALPGVGAGVTGGYALRLPGVRLELTGGWWPGRRREYAEPAGVGGRAQVGAAALRVCPTLRLRRPARAGAGLVELPLCAAIELGGLVVRGFGFPDARTVRTLWAAAELQPGVVWRFTSRLALWAALGLVVPITRESFVVDPLPELFAVGPAGLRAGVGLEVHLGRAEKN